MKNNNSVLKISLIILTLTVISFVFSNLTSCSIPDFQELITRSIELDYEKPIDYKDYNEYQKDALYLVELIEQSYPRLDTKFSDFETKGNSLIKQMAEIDNDFDFEVELKKFMAQLKDGHSYCSVDFKSDERFNVNLFNSGDKWLIRNIETSIDSSLIGAQAITMNEKNISEVIKLVSQFESGENIYWQTKSFWHRINNPKYLEAAGIIATGEELKLEVLKNGAIRDITLSRQQEKNFYDIENPERKYPFSSYQNNGFSTHIDSINNFAYLQMNTSLDQVVINSEIGNYTNIITKPIAKVYVKKHFSDAKNFGLVLQELFKQVNDKSIDNLIVDLRHNTGGDERLGKQLIWYLTNNKNIERFTTFGHNSKFSREFMRKDSKEENEIYFQKYGLDLPDGEYNISEDIYNESYFDDLEKEDSPLIIDYSIPKFDGKVYVIIGKYTFSAGSVLACTMKDNNLATLVGTPTGNKPTCQTGYAAAKLPNTKTIINMSTIFMERPNKEKNDEIALFPHIEINPSFETSYISKIDESIDTILNMITISEQN